jgi:serine/threonine protein kinase
MILNASPKMIPDFYSNNLKIIIGRLLDKNPQNRPSSEELLKIIANEHQASSSFENQIFGTTGSGLGILTAR